METGTRPRAEARAGPRAETEPGAGYGAGSLAGSGPGAGYGRPHSRRQRAAPAQHHQPAAERGRPPQHGGDRRPAHAEPETEDEHGIQREDQPVRERREFHRGTGVARALEDAVDDVGGEEHREPGERDREVPGGE